MNPILLEKGHNTSGLITFLVSLVWSRSDAVNKILNFDLRNVGATYIQEWIKTEIVTRVVASKSIQTKLIDRFRNILYGYGWRNDSRSDIVLLLEEADPVDLFKFLIAGLFEWKLSFERVDLKSNQLAEVKYDMIEIKPEHYVYTGKILDLSASIERWVTDSIASNQSNTGVISYRFKEVPYLISISISRGITLKDTPIDVKQAISFPSINDSVQKIFTWDFHSAVIYDGESYSALVIVKDTVSNKDEWVVLSESKIPSNIKIDMYDQDTVNRISRQIVMVYYKIK